MRRHYHLYLILAALAVVGCKRHPDYVLIRGSETILPVAWKLADRFTELDTMPDLSAIGGGSGSGIAALISDSADIAMSSRPIQEHERLKIREKGYNLKECVVGLDALALVVNKNNPIDSISIDAVKSIFTGKIYSWHDLGGEEAEIIAYKRPESSGTQSFFSEVVLENAPLADMETLEQNAQIVDHVSANPHAIGYIGIAYVDTALVKPLSIYSGKLPAVAPSIERISAGDYPWTRKLYFYYAAENEDRVGKVIQYVESEAGRKLVEKVGYLAVQKQ
ncbi:MAG: phosphate ABC transporter substrate-binding protein [Bacteroidetes bacterium]|nr:phosphate ABC transporter substrate-binding protein [Bacteroidota bacterium]